MLPVEKIDNDKDEAESEDAEDPLMLLALNADESVGWDELEDKVGRVSVHLDNRTDEIAGKNACDAFRATRGEAAEQARKRTHFTH